jgi:hypothetical protein
MGSIGFTINFFIAKFQVLGHLKPKKSDAPVGRGKLSTYCKLAIFFQKDPK